MAALAQGIAEQDDMAVRSLAELIAEQERAAAAASLAQGIAEHVCGPRAKGDPAMEETLGVVSCWGEMGLSCQGLTPVAWDCLLMPGTNT